MHLIGPTSNTLIRFERKKQEVPKDVFCFKIEFNLCWPNLTWHVHGGTTHPGQPGPISCCVDDRDQGDKTRTSAKGGRDEHRAHDSRPYNIVPQRWRLKSDHGGRGPHFNRFDWSTRTRTDPTSPKHYYSLASSSPLRVRRFGAPSAN